MYNMEFDWNNTLNHGLDHGWFFPLFKFFWWKYLQNVIEDSGLKFRILYSLIFQMYKLICQKTAQFLFAQMAVLSSFDLQMFIVLGMYNFAAKLSLKRWQDIYFTVVNCLFYRSTWFPQSFINQRLLTIGLPHQLELGLSKKHTKFEKIFFMVLS